MTDPLITGNPLPADHLVEQLIRDFLPDLYHDDPAGMVAFVEAYFEWLATINLDYKLLSYRDVSTTLDQFLDHFRKKYMEAIPSNIKADPRLLQTYILDLYRSKGTIRGTKLLFQVVFGTAIDVYLPSRDLLIPSDCQWVIPMYVEVSPSSQTKDLIEKTVFGASSGASATVEQYISQYVHGKKIDVLYLSNIKGSFQLGEKLGEAATISTVSILAAPTILGSLGSISFVQGGQDFEIGDNLRVITGDGIDGEVRVNATGKGTGGIGFEIEDGGSGYTVNAIPIITRGNPAGTGAGFVVGSISSIEFLDINTDLLDDFDSLVIANTTVASVTVNAGGTGYANGQFVIFTPTPVIINATIANTGAAYSNADTIVVSNTPGTGFTSTIATDNAGHIVEVDVRALGHGYTGSPVFTVNTSTGSGAVIVPVVMATGSGANATITTNSTGGITSVAVSNGGVDFLYSPILTVNTVGGASANLTAVIGPNTNYGFAELSTANISSNIDDSLAITTYQVGKIAALANVAAGSNYSSTPGVTVGDYIYTSNAAGSITFTTANTTINGTGTAFQSLFVANSVVALQTGSAIDHRRVVSVASNTSMIVDDYPAFASSGGSSYRLALPMIATNYPSYAVAEANGSIPGENASIVGSPSYGQGVIRTAAVTHSGYGYSDGELVQLAQYGALTNLSIKSGGQYYSNNDVVFFTGGEGQGARALVLTDSNGTVTSTSFVSTGNGYVSKPVISIKSDIGFGAELDVEVGAYDLSYFVTGRINLTGVGKSRGQFLTTDSFLNSDKYIQDSYYYQRFSYEIQSSLSLEKYSNGLKRLFHPAGTELFGKVITADTAGLNISDVITDIVESA